MSCHGRMKTTREDVIMDDSFPRSNWQHFTPCIDGSKQQQSQQACFDSQTNNASPRKILSNRCGAVTSDSIYPHLPYSESTMFNSLDSSKAQDLRASPVAVVPKRKNTVKTISVDTIPFIPSPKRPKIQKSRTIFSYKSWDGPQNRWSPTKTYTDEISVCPDSCAAISTTPNQFRVSLRRGGELHVFPNLIDPERVQAIKQELLETNYWRKYSIQGGEEPRLHFLAHQDATKEFDDKPQPGYRYAQITMKARPLSSMPKLQQLSKDMAVLRNIPNGKWNIGVHPVLYRDNKDSMGDHADDDQGETRILCLLLDSPPTPRKVVVKVFDKLTGGKREKDRVHQDGDEFIELFLRPGDAYEMDGLMQKSYSHCVPKDTDKRNKDKRSRRICVVLRTGDEKYFDKDTGEACVDLSPRQPIKYLHGHIDGLKEGSMYTRRELKKMNAFQLPQRGISGSYKSGADAIIVSGKRCGCDSIDTLKYVAEWRIGANSLVMSFVNERPIRVFRSAKYIRTYNLGTTNGALDGGTSFYRYDGLYNIVGMHAPPNPQEPFEFTLNRRCNFFLPRLSFDSTMNELFQERKNATVAIEERINHGGKRTKWSREIGPKDVSCCATLLLLGNESLIQVEKDA